MKTDVGEIRVGQVSSVDYENGMVRVAYMDRDGAVTDALPVLTFNDEYKMPAVGQYVLVVHLSSGTEAGFVLGSFWDESNQPARAGTGIYRKELGSGKGQAYIESSDGNIGIAAGGNLTFSDSGGSLTLAEIRKKLSEI